MKSTVCFQGGKFEFFVCKMYNRAHDTTQTQDSAHFAFGSGGSAGPDFKIPCSKIHSAAEFFFRRLRN
jgi:hypothetical protein